MESFREIIMSYKCTCIHTTKDHSFIKEESKFGECSLCDCKAYVFACQVCGHDLQDHEFCNVDSKVQCSHCKYRCYIGG